MTPLEQEILQVVNQVPGAIEKAFAAFVERHPGHANQKTHGNRHGVGGLREFAGQRGYQIRQVKGKDGKAQFAITDKNDKRTNMRAGGLTEARHLIRSSDKSKKQSAKSKDVFHPVNVLNRQRAGAVDFAKMLQARGQDLGQVHKEIADIEARIKSLGGKIKF